MYAEISKDKPIVQKYGGTSVGTIERISAVADRVARLRAEGWSRIAVVVSAMAGETNRFVDLIRRVSNRPDPRWYDLAVSAGEQVSSALTAAALEARGVPARAFLAYQIGLLTDGMHAQARIQSIETERLEDCWRAGAVPVVAGFQGVNERMELTTLGRGGSDISAVALAVAVGASFCEINTDVAGVYTADPRIVPNARLVEVLDYDSALEMAALGSKVLHSRCVELGAKFSMPIVVRNSFEPDEARRTRIMSFTQQQALEAPLVSGVSLDRNVAKFTLQGLGKDSKTISRLFEAIAEEGINVDIIIQNLLPNKTTMRMGFTVGSDDADRTVSVLDKLRESHEFADMSYSKRLELAKVSVVGLGMKSLPGVASRAFCVLANKGIEIVMISTSEIKISCVVPLEDGECAAQSLHDAFFH